MGDKNEMLQRLKFTSSAFANKKSLGPKSGAFLFEMFAELSRCS